MVSAVERIVWSADVSGEHEVLTHLDLMRDLRCVKIDRLFVERHGKFILALLRDRGLNVFYDAKYVEIPSKLEDLAKEGVSHEPWMLNCMAGSISNGDMSIHENRDLMDGLRRFADVCHSAGTKPCGVTVLTSKTKEVVSGEFNGRTAVGQVLYYVEDLIVAGFTDVVCSPHEVVAIHEEFGNAIDLNTPGVRFADSDAGDQARVATPGSAIQMGSTRIIMGRPLMGDNPSENLARAVTEVETALTTA